VTLRLRTGVSEEQRQARGRLADESWEEKARLFGHWAALGGGRRGGGTGPECGPAGAAGVSRGEVTVGMALRTTLVGCGAVAQKLYRRPLQALERQGALRVIGLVDSHPAHAQTMRRSFPSAAAHVDLEHALRAGESDLTLILSPARFHADQALVALRHQNHVLCEKPMATSEEKCTEMVAAARERNRVLAVGMIRRFIPSFAQLKGLIARGGLGEVCSFSYREGKVFDWDVKTPAGFTNEPGGGGGLLFDIGPHVIDTLTWLFGALDVVSYADDALGGVEGNVLMELDSAACPGSVHLSWDFPLRNELRVVGSRAEAVLRLDQFDKLAIKAASQYSGVVIDYRYPTDACQTPRETMSPRLYTESIYCQLIQFVRAIRLGEPPAVGGEAGRECVRVIESARHRAQPIDMPWLDADQQAAYRSLHWANA
jgi:predicted dehydrogenase